jgi:hypothetical protein
MSAKDRHLRAWVPAFAGMTGGGWMLSAVVFTVLI